MEEQQIYAVVRGRVQGVGFRVHTQHEAEFLGLGGYVRNLPDGAVEVMAQGAEHRLRELIAWLNHGPSSARVDELHWEWTAGHTLPRPFTIR